MVDLELLYPSPSSHTHVKWEEYDPLLFKLQSVIPPSLPDSKLIELNSAVRSSGRGAGEETTQTLRSLLYEELCTHNTSLVQLQASLRELFTFTNGDALFTTQIGMTLKSIRDNRVPTAWKSVLPFPLGWCCELVPSLNLLKHRMDFYSRALEAGGSLPMELNPYLFSNLQDMISRILHASPSSSQIDARVSHAHYVIICVLFLKMMRLITFNVVDD